MFVIQVYYYNKNVILWGGVITFHLIIVQSCCFLASKMIASVHMLSWMYNEILYISTLKKSFHTYCQILTSIHKHMILNELIHHLESIYRILLQWSLDICLLVCHYIIYRLITSNSRLGGGFSNTLLEDFKVSFALSSRSEEYCWNCSFSLENISATNVCGNGNNISCFNF